MGLLVLCATECRAERYWHFPNPVNVDLCRWFTSLVSKYKANAPKENESPNETLIAPQLLRTIHGFEIFRSSKSAQNIAKQVVGSIKMDFDFYLEQFLPALQKYPELMVSYNAWLGHTKKLLDELGIESPFSTSPTSRTQKIIEGRVSEFFDANERAEPAVLIESESHSSEALKFIFRMMDNVISLKKMNAALEKELKEKGNCNAEKVITLLDAYRVAVYSLALMSDKAAPDLNSLAEINTVYEEILSVRINPELISRAKIFNADIRKTLEQRTKEYEAAQIGLTKFVDLARLLPPDYRAPESRH